MNDMSQVIIPKSDQINADDLIAGPMTITIRDVQISGGQEQPVSIYFDGSDKAFRPCKSMSRVLVYGWGPDAKVYVGRSLTLYRDPEVKWGGMAVGGIRISHLSHVDGPTKVMLTEKKGSRKVHTILPLVVEQSKPAATEDKAKAWADKLIATIKASAPDQVAGLIEKHVVKLAELEAKRPELHKLVMDAAAPSDGFDDDFADDAPHPASALADRLIGAAQGASSIADLDQLEMDSAKDVAAMPDEIGSVVKGAFETARARLAKVPA